MLVRRGEGRWGFDEGWRFGELGVRRGGRRGGAWRDGDQALVVLVLTLPEQARAVDLVGGRLRVPRVHHLAVLRADGVLLEGEVREGAELAAQEEGDATQGQDGAAGEHRGELSCSTACWARIPVASGADVGADPDRPDGREVAGLAALTIAVGVLVAADLLVGAALGHAGRAQREARTAALTGPALLRPIAGDRQLGRLALAALGTSRAREAGAAHRLTLADGGPALDAPRDGLRRIAACGGRGCGGTIRV